MPKHDAQSNKSVEPFMVWDDLQACVPKWWDIRGRIKARRFYQEVQRLMERENISPAIQTNYRSPDPWRRFLDD
jgi:hypothetical protein